MVVGVDVKVAVVAVAIAVAVVAPVVVGVEIGVGRMVVEDEEVDGTGIEAAAGGEVDGIWDEGVDRATGGWEVDADTDVDLGINAEGFLTVAFVEVEVDPIGIAFVAETPLGGAGAVSKVFSLWSFFFLRLLRECVEGLPWPGGTWVTL